MVSRASLGPLGNMIYTADPLGKEKIKETCPIVSHR